MKRCSIIVGFLLAAGAAAIVGASVRTAPATEPASSALVARPGAVQSFASYPLSVCPVTGETLTKKSITKEIDGREVRFANDDAAAKFEADKVAMFAKLDKMIIDDQMAIYPLKECVIAGDPLEPHDGEMPIDMVRGNRLIRVCCKGCIGEVDADLPGVMAKLDEAILKAQGEKYPLENCVIQTDEKLGGMGDTINLIVGNRLVKVCCKGCVKKVKANPSGAIATIDAAWKK